MHHDRNDNNGSSTNFEYTKMLMLLVSVSTVLFFFCSSIHYLLFIFRLLAHSTVRSLLKNVMSHYERVRVISRIRPFTTADPDDADLAVVVVDNTHVSVDGKFVYAVDHVYQMESKTEDIFNEVVQPLLNDFLSGYNITLMAYGQTGTGKTYTMDGLTPLVIGKIVLDGFKGNIEELSFQYIEVYGDTLRDLLSEDPIESTKHLQLYDDTSVDAGGTILQGAVRVRARSLRQVMEVVEYGARMRATGATNINEYSSRSHSIFTIFNHRDKSKLHLVDLAGSERVNKTKNVGQRFQESIAINTGLLALGNVIRALRKNHSSQGNHHHVPYRSSKLTRLLQDSLGGNSRTVFIACIAPDSYNRAETKRTLEYCTLAQRVLNAPIPNYADLYGEQAGVRGGNASEDYLLSGADNANFVSQEAYNVLLAEKEKKDEENQLLRREMERMHERMSSLEKELKKDETIFKRQIHELQRLVAENDQLRRRTDFLEGRPHPVEKNWTKSGTAREASSVVEKVMRMHGLMGDSFSAVSHVDAAAPNYQSETSLNDAAPMDNPNSSLSPNNKMGESDHMLLQSERQTQHPVCSNESRPRNDNDFTVEIAQKALSYQKMNSELKGKLSTLQVLLDEQRRESALLRLEVQQIRQATPRGMESFISS